MRYWKEYRILIVVAAVLVGGLLIVGYVPTFWTAGDNTPLEHSLDSPPPADVRQP